MSGSGVHKQLHCLRAFLSRILVLNFPFLSSVSQQPNPHKGHCSVLVPRLTSSFWSPPAQTFTLNTYPTPTQKTEFTFLLNCTFKPNSHKIVTLWKMITSWLSPPSWSSAASSFWALVLMKNTRSKWEWETTPKICFLQGRLTDLWNPHVLSYGL